MRPDKETEFMRMSRLSEELIIDNLQEQEVGRATPFGHCPRSPQEIRNLGTTAFDPAR
mgnify:CR=1 FL=1